MARGPAASREGDTRVAITRDSYFSNVGAENDGNLGGSRRLKVKSIQEMSLLDFDPDPLSGRVIQSADLYLHTHDLARVSVSTLAAEWYEGTGAGYELQNGSSTFRSQRHPNVPWTKRGGDLISVALGQGGTIWRTADAFAADAAGYQRVAVDPAVVAARVAGVSHGLVVFDDTGTEWTRSGDSFKLQLFPNRFFDSREAGAAVAPYLTVRLGAEDRQPPEAPSDITSQNDALSPGEALVRWRTPRDRGDAGTIGFFVQLGDQAVPRYLVPAAGKPGDVVELHLADMNLAAGSQQKLSISAVDGAGNRSQAAEVTIAVAGKLQTRMPKAQIVPAHAAAALPKLGQCEIAIIDALDTVSADGELIPPHAQGYLAANHLWNAAAPQIELHAARNEFVELQIALRGAARGVVPTVTFADDKHIRDSFTRFTAVTTPRGPVGDPLVPVTGPVDLDRGSLLCELYVPHDAAPGEHKGTLSLRAGQDVLEIPLQLMVWNFTLPDYLSFIPEMNCYDLPDNERAYYRLAHAHRTVLNRVPYYQNGRLAEGCAPNWNGRQLEWSAWERRFGPLLDGSAFSDLPRRGVPLECLYLPIHENWPGKIDEHYNGDYWADRAFRPEYRQALVEVSRQMVEHFQRRGWHDTLFHAFFNGKNNFKERGWSRGSSPWLLDEPANFQDYWALAWFGAAIHEGVAKAPGDARILFRCDISRPQWQRDLLDDVLDYNVVAGAAFRRYGDMVRQRQRKFGQIVVEYGATNDIGQSNYQPLVWSLDAWRRGGDGVLPWQTIGSAESWRKADALSLFYPPPDGAEAPIPSVRLKAYRRGQQLVEYLTLWLRQTRQPRWALADAVGSALALTEKGSSREAAGDEVVAVNYADVSPQKLHEFRQSLGVALSAAKPAPARRLVDFRTPRRNSVAPLETRLARGEMPPHVPRWNLPGEPNVEPAGVAHTIQGRPAVRDAILDPSMPDAARGSEPRSNALVRQDAGNALVVRFDLAGAGLVRGARVVRATASIFVWDPSTRGRTKVVAAAVTTPWDEAKATWRRATAENGWKGAGGFSLEADAGPLLAQIVVEPEAGADTADPPIEYRFDVTETVRRWHGGMQENLGLAIVPIVDRAIDEGQFSRFQIYASEYRQADVTPKLVVEVAK